MSLIRIISCSMIDSKQYKGKICGYEVTLTLTKDFMQIIYYEETDSARVYTAIFSKNNQITTSAVTSRAILEVFRSFSHLYQYIEDYAEDQRRVNISNAGYFTITYFKTKTLNKKTKTKVLEFDGRKLVSQQELKQQTKIRSEVIDVRAENAFLKETLLRLERQYQESTNSINILRTQLLSKKYDYLNDLKHDTKQLRQSAKHTSRESDSISQLNLTIRELKQQVHSIIEIIKTKQFAKPELNFMPVLQQQAGEDQVQRYGQQHWVTLDLNNKFIEGHYRVQGDTLHKIGIYSSYQVLGKDPFPLTGKHYFSVFIQKINWSIFSLGIVNQNRRNYQHSHQSKECITYFAKNGTIWEQGFCRGGGPMIEDGGTEMRVVVDLDKEIIKWIKNGVEIGSTMIGKNLLGKRLVPYIQLNYPNNRVTFNRRQEKTQRQKQV